MPQLEPQGSPVPDTPSNVFGDTADNNQPEEEIEAMSTQEALRMYAPQQKVRDKILAGYKSGLNADELATKHTVAVGTVQAIITRYQQLETMGLSKSTRWRRNKKAKAEAEEAAAKKALEPPAPSDCAWAKMKHYGACIACTVKFQRVALGRMEQSGSTQKRTRTHYGCKSCRVHLCRRWKGNSSCWDTFHEHCKP
jgi:transposase